MTPSVESVCNCLARNRLLPPAEIRSLRQQWLGQSGATTAEAGQFARWLVANQIVTDYQAAVLLGRRSEPLGLGPYKILARVVSGRMVGVYKAIHPQGQVVAIKILPPAKAADPTLRARFEREARLAVKLQHPNVVHTFQAGEEGGVPFLVMEYLEGQTLKDVLRYRGRLPSAEAMRLMYQAFQGLRHIFEVGLIHRDLEPDNLMLVPSGAVDPAETTLQCSLKILDIGLGRALFDVGTPGMQSPVYLTETGDSLGMPDYRSPEQTRDARNVDIRSDIYSLGCVFYHALVGEPPFVDSNPVRLILRHATESPSPLAQFNLNPPPGLQKVLDNMLAKDPALRYPTPEMAVRDLRGLLAPG